MLCFTLLKLLTTIITKSWLNARCRWKKFENWLIKYGAFEIQESVFLLWESNPPSKNLVAWPEKVPHSIANTRNPPPLLRPQKYNPPPFSSYEKWNPLIKKIGFFIFWGSGIFLSRQSMPSFFKRNIKWIGNKE